MTPAQPAHQGARRPRQFTGQHMLIIMLAFFGVIVSVNMTMAVLAGRSWTGLVVKNSYVASQNFNEELQAAYEQRKRGWQSALAYKNNEVQFSLRDQQGQPVILKEVKLHYGRPAFEQADQTVVLKQLGDGIYRAPIALMPGIWAFKIVGGTSTRRYRRDSRIRIANDGNSGQEE